MNLSLSLSHLLKKKIVLGNYNFMGSGWFGKGSMNDENSFKKKFTSTKKKKTQPAVQHTK